MRFCFYCGSQLDDNLKCKFCGATFNHIGPRTLTNTSSIDVVDPPYCRTIQICQSLGYPYYECMGDEFVQSQIKDSISRELTSTLKDYIEFTKVRDPETNSLVYCGRLRVVDKGYIF